MQERLCEESGSLTSQLLDASHKIASYAARLESLDKVRIPIVTHTFAAGNKSASYRAIGTALYLE